MQYRDRFLDCLVAKETMPTACSRGCPNNADGNKTVFWRCDDCSGHPIYCTSCCALQHAANPLHRVTRWNGTCWEQAALRDTGVVVHFGHGGLPCPVDENILDEDEFDLEDSENPDPLTQTRMEFARLFATSYQHSPDQRPVNARRLRVVHDNGVHHVWAQYCTCSSCPPDPIQVLSYGWFPSSFERVKTVFTTHVLSSFRLESLECDTAANKFWTKIQRLTSWIAPDSIPVSVRCSRLPVSDVFSQDLRREMDQATGWYDYLTKLLEHGFAHSEKEAALGDLAYFCAGCPRIGINIAYSPEPEDRCVNLSLRCLR